MAKSKPGIRLGDVDFIQSQADIVSGKTVYEFPKDMDELLYLNVEGFYFTLEDQRIVLAQTPEVNLPKAITIHYRTL